MQFQGAGPIVQEHPARAGRIDRECVPARSGDRQVVDRNPDLAAGQMDRGTVERGKIHRIAARSRGDHAAQRTRAAVVRTTRYRQHRRRCRRNRCGEAERNAGDQRLAQHAWVIRGSGWIHMRVASGMRSDGIRACRAECLERSECPDALSACQYRIPSYLCHVGFSPSTRTPFLQPVIIGRGCGSPWACDLPGCGSQSGNLPGTESAHRARA